jgi:SAM-dependent methyltransferase
MGIDPAALSTQITTGVLLNRTRQIYFPICNGIPRLLTFPTGVTRHFVEQHRERLERELRGFHLPDEPPKPGEADILSSFSREWLDYGWDSRSYWDRPADELNRSMHFMLDLDRRPVRDKLVLEVGIGIGGTAHHIVEQQECELVGIDLSYAVDGAYKYFGQNKLLHIVQASLFTPPFRESWFDFVYSHGVLHHTYSTKAAFEHICRLPKPGGRLYVWVYSPQQERRTLLRRVLMQLEGIVRPLMWRLPERLQTLALLPAVCLYVTHQRSAIKGNRTGSIKYGWREAVHAARDRLTPRYAHRHDDEEVSSWFRASGYRELRRPSQRCCPSFVPVHFVACTGVDGTRGPDAPTQR